MKTSVNNHIINITQNNICIENSYTVTSIDEMKVILANLHSNINLYKWCNIFKVRSYFSLINEWRAHNLLYSLGLFKSRTKDVDLNNIKWYYNIPYCILSFLYPHI